MSREIRAKKVKEALAISSVDAPDPSDECVELLQSYIEGKSTIEENKKIIINKYINKYINKKG